jgi:hypothetical protein
MQLQDRRVRQYRPERQCLGRRGQRMTLTGRKRQGLIIIIINFMLRNLPFMLFKMPDILNIITKALHNLPYIRNIVLDMLNNMRNMLHSLPYIMNNILDMLNNLLII